MRKLTNVAVMIALLGLVTVCKSEKEKAAHNLAVLSLLGQNVQLSPEQKSASASVNGAVSASNGAQNNGGMVALGAQSIEQELIAQVFENGLDPVVARESAIAIANLHKDKKSEVQLTAINTHSTTYPNFTFDGSVTGVGIQVQNIDIGAIMPFLGACSVNYVTADPGIPTGTATFANGTLTFTGSGSGSSFSGSSAFAADVTFAGFGAFYTDWLEYIIVAKNPPDTSGAFTCEAFKDSFSRFLDVFYKYSVFQSGTAHVTHNRTYSSESTGTSLSANSSFTATVNSPAGLMIQEYENGVAGTAKLVTLENVTYGFQSSMQVLTGTPGTPPISANGGISVNFSGTVNGVAIDQSFAINF
ncbi:hypothetical protein [Leptospira perolatii]|nr:hypothetical protein [Leptospira perolatii]